MGQINVTTVVRITARTRPPGLMRRSGGSLLAQLDRLKHHHLPTAGDTFAEEIHIRIWDAWKPARRITTADGLQLPSIRPKPHHTLGNSIANYYVDMIYRNTSTEAINQRYYGGMDIGAILHLVIMLTTGGAYWRSLNESTITVYRRPEDTYAEEIRIRIWVMPTPDYNSGWTALPHNTAQTFTHNLYGSTSDYLVDLQYYTPGSGYNQRYYSGMDYGAYLANENDRVGAYWRNLTNTEITVYVVQKMPSPKMCVYASGAFPCQITIATGLQWKKMSLKPLRITWVVTSRLI